MSLEISRGNMRVFVYWYDGFVIRLIGYSGFLGDRLVFIGDISSRGKLIPL